MLPFSFAAGIGMLWRQGIPSAYPVLRVLEGSGDFQDPGCPDGRSSAILPCRYSPYAMPISKLRHNKPLQSALDSTFTSLLFRSVAVRPG